MASKMAAVGAGTIGAFREVMNRLLDEAWPLEFSAGLQIIEDQLIALEHMDSAELDQQFPLALLPIFDALERARRQARELGASRVSLFDTALTELEVALGRFDVRPDRPLGTEFDPHVHEAVGVLATRDIPSGRVVEIAERGWYRGTEQIRPSKVVVSKMTEAAPGLAAA